ncbi:hypothetical protein ACFXC9_04185 [Streptomyces naganishii]|uniref:hypothetical protein n=1 Tax=Streptomyces naganishii TaxID=285447 RepID=UPI0036A3BDA4
MGPLRLTVCAGLLAAAALVPAAHAADHAADRAAAPRDRAVRAPATPVLSVPAVSARPPAPRPSTPRSTPPSARTSARRAVAAAPGTLHAVTGLLLAGAAAASLLLPKLLGKGRRGRGADRGSDHDVRR